MDKGQVRTGLPAGGSRIRTAGPTPYPQRAGGLVFGNLNYTYADLFNFDFVRDTAMLNANWGSGPNDYNTIDPDIQAFNQRGGKALFYHGWGDIEVNPIAGYQYYDTVIEVLGPQSGGNRDCGVPWDGPT